MLRGLLPTHANPDAVDPLLHGRISARQICLQVVSRWTGIPVDRLQQTEVEKLLHLKEELHKRVVGQERAVSAVADAVLRSRAGLAARNRGSSFLFLVSALLLMARQPSYTPSTASTCTLPWATASLLSAVA